jgi:hypothetical protein
MKPGETMHMIFSNSVRIMGAGIVAALVVTAAPFFTAPAHADEHHDRWEHERERYHTRHWVLDERFRHNHYYPSVGYSVAVLPAGNFAVTFRGSRFFFHSGVWFRPAGPSYVVVRPPVGIVIPVLPSAYTPVWVGGVPYYYANDIYYTQTPGGYAVAAPPAEAAVAPAQTPPPVAPPPQAGAAPGASSQIASTSWYYCASAKGYYPYVPTCKEGWRTVPAAPPQMQ